jgi:hypothetical protein
MPQMQLPADNASLLPALLPCWPPPSSAPQVKQFYTAPTAIRSLMRSGEDWVRQADRSSLRVLGSVGEPINPEAWRWYHEVRAVLHCAVGFRHPAFHCNAGCRPFLPSRLTLMASLLPGASFCLLRRWWGASAAPLWTPGGRQRRRGT